jgi:toxin-antitoxin system PIN domain toxin
MRALLDVNVLVALLDAGHAEHAAASQWLAAESAHGWASCPITVNGCVRVMSHPGYPLGFPASAVIERLAAASAGPGHAFWPDDVSLLDPAVADASRIHGPRAVSGLYLLALALRHGGRFVTFERALVPGAIRGATSAHLVVL